MPASYANHASPNNRSPKKRQLLTHHLRHLPDRAWVPRGTSGGANATGVPRGSLRSGPVPSGLPGGPKICGFLSIYRMKRLSLKVRASQINRLELCASEVQSIKVRMLGAIISDPMKPMR
jgi:hypothetical protein